MILSNKILQNFNLENELFFIHFYPKMWRVEYNLPDAKSDG
jgi:hypothetical protein